jgi:hypothetical protein
MLMSTLDRLVRAECLPALTQISRTLVDQLIMRSLCYCVY